MEQSTARKIEELRPQEFSEEAKKFADFKRSLRAVKEASDSEDEKAVELMMKVYEEMSEHNSLLKEKYKSLNKFNELDSTELWHVVIDSTPGRKCQSFDLEGEDSIRLYMLRLLPKVNGWRKEVGLSGIKLSDLNIGIDDLEGVSLSETEIKELL